MQYTIFASVFLIIYLQCDEIFACSIWILAAILPSGWWSQRPLQQLMQLARFNAPSYGLSAVNPRCSRYLIRKRPLSTCGSLHDSVSVNFREFDRRSWEANEPAIHVAHWLFLSAVNLMESRNSRGLLKFQVESQSQTRFSGFETDGASKFLSRENVRDETLLFQFPHTC